MKKRSNLIIVLLSVFILMFFVGCGDSSEDTKKKFNFKEGQTITLKDATAFPTSDANLDKYLNFISQKNKEAANNMATNGELIVVDAGTKINIIKIHMTRVEIEIADGTYKNQKCVTVPEVLAD